MTRTELLEAMKELARLSVRHTIDQSPTMNRKLLHLSYAVNAGAEEQTSEAMATVIEDFNRWCFNTMMSG